MPSYQYAKLPKYEYQNVERQYQTFDRNTSRFSYYPVPYSNIGLLTGDKDQDNNDPVSNQSTQEEPPATTVEESSSSPTEVSEGPESSGMYDN